jgi:ankyrin repeat protein
MARYKIKSLTYRTLLFEKEFSFHGWRETLVEPLWLLISQLRYGAPEESIKITLHYIKEKNIDINRNIYDHTDTLVDQYGSGILHLAIRHRCNTEIITLLLDNDVDKDKQDYDLNVPLHVAVRNKNIKITRLLIRRKVNINMQDKHGCTALHWAIEWGNIEIIRLLIKSGSDINVQDVMGDTAFSTAILRYIEFFNNNIETVQLLIKNGADVNMRNKFTRNTALHRLLELYGFPSLYLLSYTNTSLALAIIGREKEIIQLLIENGVDINMKTEGGQTPLDLAIIGNQKEIVQLLIENGVDINMKNKEGHTPLDLAIIDIRQTVIIQLLIENGVENGVDINMKNKEEQTPLDLVAFIGTRQKEITRLLIKHGAKRGCELPVEE